MQLFKSLPHILFWGAVSGTFLRTELLRSRDTKQCTIAARNPPPPAYICGDEGYLKRISSPDILGEESAPSSTACRDLCLGSSTGCLTFSYRSPNSSCTLYRKAIKGQRFKRSSSGVNYWNRHCFKKTCTCDVGKEDCNGQCFDLLSSSQNCGSCGTSCPNDQICRDGSCSCPLDNNHLCAGSCTNTDTDNDNCGTCGTQCGAGQECSGGQCVCKSLTQLCGDSCVNRQTDSNNCGSCGNKCGDGEICSNGSCACRADLTRCLRGCVDRMSDGNNCGSCGHQCGDGATCNLGVCFCKRGFNFCGNTCVNFQTDKNNCARCGNQCGLEYMCSGGSCVCDDPVKSECGGICIDKLSDSNNCGSCGNVCASQEKCVAGTCQDVCSVSTPSIALANPINIVGDAVNGATHDVDDGMFSLTLPFPIQFYGVSSAHVGVSTNGYISINPSTAELSCNTWPRTTAYNNDDATLPYWTSDCDSQLNGKNIVAAYFDDLYIYQGTMQGIYYEVSGAAPSRSVAFEWYMSHIGSPTEYYHFLMTFYEASPNAVRIDYLQANGHGASATVGAQAYDLGKHTVFSFDQDEAIANGMSLVFDKDSNEFKVVSAGCSVTGT